MSIFKTKKEQAQAGSAKALGMFTLAVEQLEKSNALAEATIAENEAEIKRLTAERDDMAKLKGKNTTVITNIKNFLGEENLVIAENLADDFEEISNKLDEAE